MHDQSSIVKITPNISHQTISNGNIGIERESLRLDGKRISSKGHSKFLGSPLFNSFITTDFSEALFEFITPPSKDNYSKKDLLNDIHHFVFENIEGDKLWPFSMPPNILNDDEIRIAEYGRSNLALFKMAYRNGLSYRYGRKMQAIAGIHYNYSFPEKLWDTISNNYSEKDPKSIKSELYFSCIRNTYRFNWLLLYLFGASPLITKDYLKQNISIYPFQKHKDFLFLPNATSLRMSDLGYQNSRQSKIKVSINSLDSYLRDLLKATSTRNQEFSHISEKSTKELMQINSNYLQIEDEYYAPCRPKSNISNSTRLLSKLKEGGVDYIEIRSLDLDPFSRIGINIETMNFLEAFTIYCAIKESPSLNLNERKETESNNLIVAIEGRKEDVTLQRNDKSVKLKDWANEIIDEMGEIMTILDINQETYKRVINDPQETTSAKYLNMILDSNYSFHEIGLSLADDNASYYQKLSSSDNLEVIKHNSEGMSKKQDPH